MSENDKKEAEKNDKNQENSPSQTNEEKKDDNSELKKTYTDIIYIFQIFYLNIVYMKQLQKTQKYQYLIPS